MGFPRVHSTTNRYSADFSSNTRKPFPRVSTWSPGTSKIEDVTDDSASARTGDAIRASYSQQRVEDLFQGDHSASINQSQSQNKTWDAWLLKQFPSCYRSMVKMWELVCGSGKLDLDPRIADNRLRQLHGINGLSNHHGTCYLNTALQLLAQTVRINLEKGDCSKDSQNYKMMEVISEKMPTLMNLVNRTPMKEADLKRLYQEASRLVGEQKMYAFLSKRKITPNQLETGYATGGVSAHYFHTFLSALKVTPTTFEVKSSYEGEHYQKAVHTTTNLYYQAAAGFHDAFQKKNSIANVLTQPPPNVLNMLLVDREKNQHSIQNILSPIMFSLDGSKDENKKEGSVVSYEPVMISIEPKDAPHTYAFFKKEGSWFEVNDGRIFAIPKTWEKELEEFCGRFATLITYEQVPNAIPTPEMQAPQEQDLSQDVPAQLKANGIDMMDRALYSVFGCPESFFTAHATRWLSS
jgi:hypothetical protein